MTGHEIPENAHTDYAHAVDRLVTRFEGRFSREEVEAAVREARGELEPQSTISDFLGVLVERRARELLEARTP